MSVPLSGIICTIGPSSQRADVLLEMIQAGMRVVRLNLSHGSHEYHCKTIQEARKAIAMYQEKTGLPKALAIALDTKGPEIRTGKLAGGGDKAEIELKPGDKVILSTNKELENNCTKDKIFVDYQKLASSVKPGDQVFLDDGLIALGVRESKGEEVTCEVENGGKLGSHKGVNLPGVAVDLPAVTEKDKQDLEFGVDQKVDMIFASFIRDANALTEIRKALGPAGERIKVISKIENQQGLTNINKIILASDGIMVARGDLGIEIPTENVPLAQKLIIAKCNKVGKPVICATHMLESMTTKPRPTRAEAADVANAIFDGADAVMLSGETAKGKYPVESVRVMAKICAKVESVLWYESIQNSLKREIRISGGDHVSAITTSIAEAATVGQARAIVVASPCSMVAQMVSHARPPCPIVMLTGCPSEAAHSVLFRGIHPLLVEDMVIGNFDDQQVMKSGLKLMTKMDLIEPGQKGSVVLVNAMSADKITFSLHTFQQQTKAEREQEDRCQKLALEQSCKEWAEKEASRKLKMEKECRKLLEAERSTAMEKPPEAQSSKLQEESQLNMQICKQGEESKKQKTDTEASKGQQLKEERQKQAIEICKRMAEEEKRLLARRKKKLEQAPHQKTGKETAEIEAPTKAKLAGEEAKKKELLEKCKQLAEEIKKKEEKEDCKLFQKTREELAKKKEELEKCKQLAEKRKKKVEEEECKRLQKTREETAKLEAAKKAKLAEDEAKKKEELAECKQLAEESKKKEEEEECNRRAAEKKKAERAKRFKQVLAAREKKKVAELCKKLEEEREKSRK